MSDSITAKCTSRCINDLILFYSRYQGDTLGSYSYTVPMRKSKPFYKNRVSRLSGRLKKMLLYIRELKNTTKCKDCGKFYPYYCMDFDHIKGNKKFDIGKAVSLQVSMKELRLEIAKCQIVCALCHRIRTHQRRLRKCKKI